MAFYQAHCDYHCNGCEQNNGEGWCIFFDRSIGGYVSDTFTTTEMFNKNEDDK